MAHVYGHNDFFKNLKDTEIKKIIEKSGDKNLSDFEFLTLLSPLAKNFLEDMALKANQITIKNFGKEIQLYAPLYISNICDNECSYCGFKHSNQIKRRHLNLDEIEITLSTQDKFGHYQCNSAMKFAKQLKLMPR